MEQLKGEIRYSLHTMHAYYMFLKHIVWLGMQSENKQKW